MTPDPYNTDHVDEAAAGVLSALWEVRSRLAARFGADVTATVDDYAAEVAEECGDDDDG